MNGLGQSDRLVLLLIAASVVAAIGATAWLFLAEKQYDFIVEDACDPQAETCYVRDCSIENECPPNGLDSYKVFQIKAADFPLCSYNSCARKCASGIIACIPVPCDPDAGDTCSSTEEG